MKKSFLITSILLLGLFISSSYAVEVTLLGPQKYLQTKGKPSVYTDNFPGRTGVGILKVMNGDANGKNRISSAVILINGVEILGPNDFNQNAYNLEVPISLEENNTISVELRSKPGSYLWVQVNQEIEADCAGVIGPEGGTVITSDEMVSIEIPAGSLSEDTIITISRTGKKVLVGDMHEFGPDGLNFTNFTRIYLTYNSTILPPNVLEDDLYLVTSDSGGYIEPLENIIVNKVDKTVSGETSHFSEVWITYSPLVVCSNNNPIVPEDIPVATSFRVPIGDSRDFNNIILVCHDERSQSLEDIGDNLDLLTMDYYVNNYPKIEFNAGGMPNSWIVAVAFNKDKYLKDYNTGLLGDYGVFHPGEDWNNRLGGASDNGMPIHVIADGTILFSQKQISDKSKRPDKTIAFGNIVVVGHRLNDGRLIASAYAHMQELSPCSVGENIKKGDIIGLIGDTGLQFENNHHLHFELIKAKEVENASSNIWKFHTPLIDQSSGHIYIRYCKNGGWYWPKTESLISENYILPSPSDFIKSYSPLPPPNANVSITPDSGPTGTQFLIEWSEFTPNRTLTSHLKKPDGTEFPPLKFNMDSQGKASHTIDSTGFQAGTYEHWAVDDATGKVSNTVFFTITVPCPPPNTPSNPSPSNGATNVSISTDLDWSDCSGATSYDVYFGASSPPPLAVNVTTSSYNPGTLNYNTTYYWRIVAKNECGETSGQLCNFSTQTITTQHFWARAYGIGDFDWFSSVQQTDDGGYIIGGIAGDCAGCEDFWVLKLTPFGEIEWQRSYGSENKTDWLYSLQQTNDGGYIIGGSAEDYPLDLPTHYCLVLKISSNGNIEWQRKYGFGAAYSIQQTSDGGYITANGGKLLKLSSNGNFEWQRRFGESDYGFISISRLRCVQQTINGGFILTFDLIDPIFIGCLILKLTSNGDIEWQRIYGGNNRDFVNSIQQTNDRGYIVAGSTDSFGVGDLDFYVMKLSSIGNIEWQRTYGGGHPDEAHSIQQTNDRGYIVAGSTESFGSGGRNFWVLKISSVGDIEWQRTYGGTFFDGAYSIQQATDGGYIVGGVTGSFAGDVLDILILRLSPDGYIDQSCGEFIGSSEAIVSDTNIIPQEINMIAQETADIIPENTNFTLKINIVNEIVICLGLGLLYFR